MDGNCFKGRTVLVTGGATGIGAAIVERFAMSGAEVTCCYNKSVDTANALAEKLKTQGKDIHLVRMNVTSSDQVRGAVESIAEHFGNPVNVLVNNAGDIIDTAPIESMDENLWDEVISVNLRGTFLCSKYCIPGMKVAGGGRIINLSSISARSGGGIGAAHYAASKGAIEAFTRALAKELAQFNITANAVSPGVIDTPMHARHNTPESLEKLRELVPLKRLGAPEQVAGVVAFLAHDDASYITGEVVAVNGGLRMD